MPAKEISLNELKVTGAAGKVLHRSLTKNKAYDGTPRGVPAGVKGEATLLTIKVMASEKPQETWIMVNTSAMVTSPEEYKGRQVYPGYTYGKSTLTDAEKVDDTVTGIIRFMYNLGIPEAAIEKAKSAQPADFVYTAVKTIEAHCGKGTANFKFTTRPQKKDPSRTECLANGPTETSNSGEPAAQAPEKVEGIPQLDEIWNYGGEECRVTGVNTSTETVTLEPLDGSAPYEDISWYDESGNPQIDFVR